MPPRAPQRRRRRPIKRELLGSLAITSIVTAGMTLFLIATVNRFDLDELKELAALVTALGPTAFAALRYLKET